jgi:hypothetical protein
MSTNLYEIHNICVGTVSANTFSQSHGFNVKSQYIFLFHKNGILVIEIREITYEHLSGKYDYYDYNIQNIIDKKEFNDESEFKTFLYDMVNKNKNRFVGSGKKFGDCTSLIDDEDFKNFMINGPHNSSPKLTINDYNFDYKNYVVDGNKSIPSFEFPIDLYSIILNSNKFTQIFEISNNGKRLVFTNDKEYFVLNDNNDYLLF